MSMNPLRPMRASRGTLRDRINPEGKEGIAPAPGRWESVDPQSPLLKTFDVAKRVYWKQWDKGVDRFQQTYSYVINNLPGLNNLLNPVAQTFQKKGESPARGGVDEIIATTSQIRR